MRDSACLLQCVPPSKARATWIQLYLSAAAATAQHGQHVGVRQPPLLDARRDHGASLCLPGHSALPQEPRFAGDCVFMLSVPPRAADQEAGPWRAGGLAGVEREVVGHATHSAVCAEAAEAALSIPTADSRCATGRSEDFQ